MGLPRIGISTGDINGIGPEIIIKALATDYHLNRYVPIIYGSAKIIAYYKNVVEHADFSFISIEHADHARPDKINVINCWQDSVRIDIGRITEDSGKAAYIALDRATVDLDHGLIDALVTAPINKKAMKMAAFNHLGHTEFIAERIGQAGEELMMMVADKLRVAVLSTHVPLADVTGLVTAERIESCILKMNTSLKQDFGIERPVMAVLGLNPHAGDNGAIGEEEEKFIVPTIKKLKESGIIVAGPYGADGFFGSESYKKFDGILAMYHDQGLVPFKTIAFGSGVNFTAGLSVIRTSPDHGTGHEIAGKSIADHTSMIQAIYYALDIVRNRSSYAEAHADVVERTTIHSESNA